MALSPPDARPQSTLPAGEEPQATEQAADCLLLRDFPWACGLIAHWAKTARLPPDLVADAQQDAWLGMVKAVRRFDPRRDCSRRTFLRKVIADRFQDFVKKYRRSESHYDRSVAAARLVEGQPHAARCPLTTLLDSPGNDPAQAVVREELCEFLEEAWRHLGEGERRLVESIVAGTPLVVVARAQGVSRITVIRQRNNALAKLRVRPRGLCV
jgi:RNA polymerase sigma factor (sigma-70 family)